MKGRVVLVLSFFIQATIVFEAGAADTTIKGTGATSATAGLEVTNSANTSLLYVRNDGNVGIGITTPATALEVYKTSAIANAVEDILTITKDSSSEIVAGIGAGVVFKIQGGGGTEEQASIDVVLTDVTSTTEDADIVFRQNVNGTMTETVRFVADTLSVALDSISSYDSAAIDITLGSDAGDDLIVDTTGFVYEGDNNRVGIGTAAPDTTLDLSGTLSYTPSATQSITGVGSTILANAAVVIIDPDGNYTLTSAPTIADGVAGQIVYITAAEAEANGIGVQDQDTLANSNLQLGAATRTIAAKDVLVLMFNGVSWVEVSYANN